MTRSKGETPLKGFFLRRGIGGNFSRSHSGDPGIVHLGRFQRFIQNAQIKGQEKSSQEGRGAVRQKVKIREGCSCFKKTPTGSTRMDKNVRPTKGNTERRVESHEDRVFMEARESARKLRRALLHQWSKFRAGEGHGRTYGTFLRETEDTKLFNAQRKGENPEREERWEASRSQMS